VVKWLIELGGVVQLVGVTFVFWDAAKVQRQLGMQSLGSQGWALVKRQARSLRTRAARIWSATWFRRVRLRLVCRRLLPWAGHSQSVSRASGELTLTQGPPPTLKVRVAALEQHINELELQLRDHEQRLASQGAAMVGLTGNLTDVVGGSGLRQVAGAILIFLGIAFTLLGTGLSP